MQSCRSTNSIFSNVSHEPCTIHVNVFLLKRLINLEGFVKKHILPSYDCGISLMCTDVVLIFDLPLCYDLAWGAGNLLHIHVDFFL